MTLSILKEHFGFQAFRFQQEAIINAVLDNRDVFVLMPTGGGKSLCYQLPALMREGITIVVSPLIALMKNQVDLLRQRGIGAAYLNSSQTRSEQDEVLEAARKGKLKLLYLAPERLVSNGIEIVRQIKPATVSLIAIDEAHCISQWGHDFRPEYRMLADVKNQFPRTPVIALTATADRLIQDDIIERLALSNPSVFVAGFDRKNIYYAVRRRKGHVYEQLLSFLHQHSGESGIIYCLSRKSTETLATNLLESGISALPYHAGMDRHTRAKHQEKFLRNEVSIIVATIAFGMGIDKPDVRFVVHMDLPKNIESYYQETGRAGRDGAPSEALLFYDDSDVAKLRRFAHVENNAEQTEVQLRKLNKMRQYGELKTCRRKFILNYFDEEAADVCGNCDVCLGQASRFDATALARKLFAVIAMAGNSYGVNYIVNILRGKKERLRRSHREHELFGSGTEISPQGWSRLIFELISLGYLKQSSNEYRNLQMTEKAHDILGGAARIFLDKEKDLSAAWNELQGEELPYEHGLLTELLALRQELTRHNQHGNGPATRTLRKIATFLPLTERDLALIYHPRSGSEFPVATMILKVVQSYCAAHQLSSRIAMMPTTKPERLRYDREQRLLQQSFTLFRLGYSVDEVARLRRISTEAASKHLAYFQRKDGGTKHDSRSSGTIFREPMLMWNPKHRSNGKLERFKSRRSHRERL